MKCCFVKSLRHWGKKKVGCLMKCCFVKTLSIKRGDVGKRHGGDVGKRHGGDVGKRHGGDVGKMERSKKENVGCLMRCCFVKSLRH